MLTTSDLELNCPKDQAEQNDTERVDGMTEEDAHALQESNLDRHEADGFGSVASERVRLDGAAKLVAWSVASAAYLFALPFWLPIVFGLDGADLIVRAGLCVLVLAPAGFLMGFGFPTGMRLVSTINAGPSALVLGHQGRCRCFSIDTTLKIGATCYLLVAAPALLLMSASARSDHPALGSLHPSASLR